VDVEATHVFLNRPHIPLAIAFLAIGLISVTGALHSSAPTIRSVKIARRIGAVVGFGAALLYCINACVWPMCGAQGVLLLGFIATVVSYGALICYFIGRWK